jgi:hypothetical protein
LSLLWKYKAFLKKVKVAAKENVKEDKLKVPAGSYEWL